MESILTLLMVEMPGHQEPDFRETMDLFWSRDHGPLIALSTNRKIIDGLYRHL